MKKWFSLLLALCMLSTSLPALAQDDAFFSLFDSVRIPEEADSIKHDTDEDDDGSKSVSLSFYGNGAAVTDKPDDDYLALHRLELNAYTGNIQTWIGMDEEYCLFSKRIPLGNEWYLSCWLQNNPQWVPCAYFSLVQEPWYDAPFGMYASVAYSKDAILPHIESRDPKVCENILDVTLESMLMPCLEACAQYAGVSLDADPAAIERKSYAGPDLSGPLHQYFDAIRLPKGFTRDEYALPTIRTDARGDGWLYDLSATIDKGNSAFKIKSTGCGLDITTGGYWDAELGELLSTRKLMNDQGFEMECRLFIDEYPDPIYADCPDTIEQEYGPYHDGNLAECEGEFRWKHHDTYFVRVSTFISGTDAIYKLSSMQVRMHTAQIMDFLVDKIGLPVLKAVSAAYEDPVDTSTLKAQPYSAGTALATLSLPAETALSASDALSLFAASTDYELCFVTVEYPTQDDRDYVDSLSDQSFDFDNYYLLADLMTDGAITPDNWYKNLKLRDIGMPNGQKAVCGTGKYGNTAYAASAQYYRDIGYIVIALSKTLSSQKLSDIANEAMLTVRLNGVTEEEMANDAAAYAAEHASDALGYVIIQKGCNIRSGPGTDHEKIGSAAEGDRFPLLGEEGNWYQIDLDGKTGYVSKGQCTTE